MTQRYTLVRRRFAGERMTDLAREFGVSRKTAYKWLARFDSGGFAALDDLSQAPHCQALATPDEMIERLVALRKARPTWGPRKLRRYLVDHNPGLVPPAPSTIGDILKRAGLVSPRRRRYRVAPYELPFESCTGPNDVWCMDFKGNFRTQDNRVCLPLTISDAASRMLLRCEGLHRGEEPFVRPVLASAFREYGLPNAIRTDNGPPFATVAPGGISALAIWFIKLGILPERIEPGKPQQNGRHERMHRTLKQEVISPPRANSAAQQRAFDRFRQIYNHERPHEALELDVPASHYTPSQRLYPRPLEEPTYPDDWEQRRVRTRGHIKWGGKRYYVTQTLNNETVGLEPVADDLWIVHFGPIKLGVLDPRGDFQRRRDTSKHRKSRPKNV